MSREPDDLTFYEMFAGLRARVIQALAGFEDRVRQQLDQAEQPRGPVASEAGARVIGEIVAMLVRLFRGVDDVDR